MKCKASCGITLSSVMAEELVSQSSDTEHSTELAAHSRAQERSQESCWAWWKCSKQGRWMRTGPWRLHQGLLLVGGVWLWMSSAERG